MNAKVESTHDDGSPETLRDEHGGLWRVAIDGADGTLAVEEICEHGGGPAIATTDEAETVGNAPCGIASWDVEGDELEISPCNHGENHTDPSTYGVNNPDEFIATPNGWESTEADEE